MLAFLMGCVATFNPITTQKPTGPELARLLKDESVALVAVFPSKDPAKYKDKVYTYCTGVFIKTDIIISANHCVEGFVKFTTKKGTDNSVDKDDDKEIKVPDNLRISYVVISEVFSPGMHPKRIHTAKLIYHNHAEDLALLQVEPDPSLPKHGVAIIAKTTPEVGETLEMMGNIERQDFSYRTVVVAAYRETMDYSSAKKLGIQGPFMQASALVGPGDSGGGSFNSNGELVGIASFIAGSDYGIVYYVGLSTIQKVAATLDK